MTTLATDIKQLIVNRLNMASTDEVLAIASTLCGTPAVQTIETALRPDLRSRWEVYDENIAFDPVTGLYMTRDYVAGGKRKWKDAIKAAGKVNFNGWKWRAPEVWELLTMVDYSRRKPAFNTDVFKGDESWVWSNTQVQDESEFAWVVGFSDGSTLWYGRNNFFVRAVRSSQY